jgi:membrane protease subunit (stomatin/prohibitin family)
MVRRSIKGMMMTSIKEVIASTIIEQNITILEISTKLSELSAIMQKKLNVYLDDLGLEMVHFYVGGISANDSDLAKLRQVKEMQLEVKAEADVEAYKLQILSEARAKARAVEGYTYQEERKYDVLESAAANNGNAGGMIGAGLGLGVGLGVIDETKRMTQSSFAQEPQAAQATAPGLRVCRVRPVGYCAQGHGRRHNGYGRRMARICAAQYHRYHCRSRTCGSLAC